MKKRNPDAKCGDCPYWDDNGMELDAQGMQTGRCLRFPPAHKEYESLFDEDCFVEASFGFGSFTAQDAICGEHPDFFMEEITQAGSLGEFTGQSSPFGGQR